MTAAVGTPPVRLTRLHDGTLVKEQVDVARHHPLGKRIHWGSGRAVHGVELSRLPLLLGLAGVASTLPEAFDLRNVDGHNSAGAVHNQHL